MMLDDQSKTLYVGKAKDLYKRLSSYARHSGAEHNKTTVMLSHVKKVDTIITSSEKEALILEASLIKRHKPKYNVILRDDKNYPLIKVTMQEEWPRVMMTRRRVKDGALYFGPYHSSSHMWSTLRLISSTFPLRKCKGKHLRPRKRPCLNHQMGKCMAPCAGKANLEEYMQHVKNVLLILEGKTKTILTKLKAEMSEAAERLDFEKAAAIRDQIQGLSKTLEKQLIVASHQRDQDIIGLHRKDASVGIAMLFVRNGIISGSRTFFLQDTLGDDQMIMSQIINQFYDNTSNLPPQEILVAVIPENIDLLQEKLSEIIDRKVAIMRPQRGDKAGLIRMADENAQNIFDEREKQAASWAALSDAMIKKLKLTNIPTTIECLDISNTSGKQAVGSLICFTEGEPAKNKYRHYSIQSKDTPDDYAMMEEVLYRRISKGLEEGDLPDLFMVDGGKGQLNVAMRVAGELGVDQTTNWLGIAKERRNEGEKLYKPGRKNPIILAAHDPVLLFLMRVRDESHRFGVTFHRKLRNKKSLTSQLQSIPGIGKDRGALLLKHFGSFKRLQGATIEEMQQVKGIGKELAKTISSALQQNNT